MADLESKLLDGENVGYCSSSDNDEEDIVKKCVDDNDSNYNEPSSHSQLKGMRNTGPKGVLDDWRLFKSEQHKQEIQKQQRIVAEAKRGMLSGGSNTDNRESDDDLERIRQERLEQLKNTITSKQKVIELQSKEQFLTAIEKCRNTLLLIHIYEDAVDACSTLNSVFYTFASKYSHLKLARVKSSILKTSQNFTLNALPTLQVYYNDVLVGNFVRITDQIGEDFDVEKVISFLYQLVVCIHYH
ncbi:unnamed protein product [Anisakis simplex]|uniref:Phosducin domain-containing protein n=1 Tax=Anisakis simplex TaxID=6269 RepID=A0A0M3J1U2_ANISI|nr:unnamed protein product [Anisakis simplex]